jgi:hypothetical protein
MVLLRTDGNDAHHTNGIEQTVLDQSIRQALIVTTKVSVIAIADGAEDPREIHSRATT